MRVLIIGSGGREHALTWKIAQSPVVKQLWCAPGNAGIAQETLLHCGRSVECIGISPENLPSLLEFARKSKPDLTVVGPDNPLAMGIVDLFRSHGLRIWGPNQSAARFESSKVFAQEFMGRYGIPTARSGTFDDSHAARAFADQLDGRCAVKADGLALGKGVLLTRSKSEAAQAIEDLMIAKTFGEAGKQVVIQELLEGMEVSLHLLCDGKTARLFPTSQDHKAAFDGDQGPNTGGMGAYSPAPFLDDRQLDAIRVSIIEPWLEGCRQEGIHFCGILYPGLMLTREGPKVLEFNARFGDPEAQVYLPRLENDLVDLCHACIDSRLHEVELRWKPDASVCVVMASNGYPGSYEKGKPIQGLEPLQKQENVKVFHAGTKVVDDQWVTSGGRVLGVTAWQPSLSEARKLAYKAVERIHFDGAHYRRDIAWKALA